MTYKESERPESVAQSTQAFNLLDCVDLPVSRPHPGILLGCIQGFNSEGIPLVRIFGETEEIPAQSTVALSQHDQGRQVAIVFINGVIPLIMGLIQNQHHLAEVQVEGEKLVLHGHQSLELRCGKASLIMKEDGKVIVKGTHLISRSSGPNKIKGASVSLN